MAHFAKLDAGNIVTEVIVVSNDDTGGGDPADETAGIHYCQELFGYDTKWKQTSYNHNFRGNYAGVGYTYLENVATLGVGSTEIFINQQPYGSWSVGVNTAMWFSPYGDRMEDKNAGLTTTQIADGLEYRWDEKGYQADTGSPKTVGWTTAAPT